MNDFVAKLKKKWILIRHLVEMKPFERAYVPMGANRWSFVVVKEAKMEKLLDIVRLEAGMQRLGQVITVLKQGNPNKAAETQLLQDVASAIDGMLPDLGVNPRMANPGLVVGEVLKVLKTVALQAQNTDYALADKLDAAAERLQTLLSDGSDVVTSTVESLNPSGIVEPEVPAVPEVEPEVEAIPESAPTVIPAETVQPEPEVIPEVTPEVTPEPVVEVQPGAEVIPEVETTPEVTPETAPEVEPVVEPVVEPEPIDPPVTLSMFQPVLDSLKAIKEQLNSIGKVTVEKQAPQVIPAAPPPDRLNAPPSDRPTVVVARHDYNQSAALKSMDRYGRPLP